MLRSVYIIICILFLSRIGFGSVYYVDKVSGYDGNSGTSVTTAWKTISKVNSFYFSPGDKILFKKGQTWWETLQITADGSSTAPITYSSYGSGSYPLIDGSLLRENCIYINGAHNVIIEYLEVKNNTGAGTIRIKYSANIEARRNRVYVTGHGGFFIEQSSNCAITGNEISTPRAIYPKQTDGIYSQRNNGNIYRQNNIYIFNSHPTEHIDGIQSYLDKNITIHDNLIRQDNLKTNSQGIYTTYGSGTHLYFNNVIDCPNTVAGVITFNNPVSTTALLNLYHNTVIGKGGNVLRVSGYTNLISKNNIFVARSSNYCVMYITSDLSNSVIDYNLYYNGGNAKLLVYKYSIKTFSDWKALGFDLHGVNSGPQLTDNYQLPPGSAALNKGVNLGAAFRFDKAGSTRPQYNVDVGAYENMSMNKLESTETVETFELSQNYPNPFNPATTIKYSIPSESDVSVKVYDIIGKEVATLVNTKQTAGNYSVQFDASNLASGIYIYRINAGIFTETKKMTLLK